MRTWSTLVVVGSVAAVGLLGGCQASKPASPGMMHAPAAQGVNLDALKTLAGTWTMKDEKGQEHVGLVVSVVASGSAVREVMFPGSEHEMVNMYHADNGTVIATHYCAGGNQPRMHAAAGSGPGVYVFRLRDITNLNLGTQAHGYMGGLTVRLVDRDHLVQDWTNYTLNPDGTSVEAGKVKFEFTRKQR
jgi:hypothetical protein